MRIIVHLSGGGNQDLLNLDVGSDMTVSDLKAVIEGDTNVPPPAQMLHFNGQLLSDPSKTLGNLGINENDMLSMMTLSESSQGTRGAQGGGRRQGVGSPPAGQRRGGGGSRQAQQNDTEMLRLQALGNPSVMEQVRQRRPALANAVQDPRLFREEFSNMMREQDQAEREKQEAIERLNRDPFDIDAQKKIEESIRQDRVYENLQYALDHSPQAFGRVHMLYIDTEVNGHKVKAFVDSGAQATIMSPSCAENCGIMRLVDERYAGIARGVGTAKIIGRVHSAQIKIGRSYFPCSFTVMEGKDVDLLLGLDMLKRHQASIDLKKGKLIIDDDEVPFLGEADIPKNEEASRPEPTVEGPAGTRVGGISGAVIPSGSPAPSGSSGTAQRAGQGESTPATSQPTQSQQSTSQFPAGDIAQLVDMGFSEQEAIGALEMAGGNVEMAAGILYD